MAYILPAFPNYCLFFISFYVSVGSSYDYHLHDNATTTIMIVISETNAHGFVEFVRKNFQCLFGHGISFPSPETEENDNNKNAKKKSTKALIFDNNDDYDSYVIMPGFRLISWAQTG
ncbi:hypothetical protein DERF_002968 [Dermatophagoides farinae]|uniref:Uncharacterized protein n=1 Tax=Dermatophagoides farinae TaxID=6954 RepID=A0A922LB12_DERFA|nr:hypothetical protein DERF_002968 [Dermatophagoides farinae]